MGTSDIAILRANKRFARQEYEKQVVGEAGAGSSGLDSAGPPTWNRAAWESFKAQYGFYPFSASQLPPTFAGAPDWVYELCNLRQPPITVSPS